jgi:hypothetical protein
MSIRFGYVSEEKEMKRLRGPDFDKHRIPAPPQLLEVNGLPPEAAMGDDQNGCFLYQSPVNRNDVLRLIVGSGHGWDHISISVKDRCPTWDEMDWVKRLFFKDNEVAFQLHVKPTDHVNRHPYTLHLWRPQRQSIPLPPSIMV